MDTGLLNALGLDPDAVPIVEAYLTELDVRLPAGRRTRGAIVAEIADGLACAVADEIDAGSAAQVAAGAAVRRCGDPATVAAAFAARMAPAAAHGVGVGLLVSGPVIGFLWLSAYTSGSSLGARLGELFTALPTFPLILAVTVPAAMIAATGTGTAARYLDLPGSVATSAAVIAAVGCVTGDVSLLTFAATGHGAVPLLAVAVVASAVRLTAACWSGRRVVQLRAVGN